jgi:phosphoserine phosphatase RsbU/P
MKPTTCTSPGLDLRRDHKRSVWRICHSLGQVGESIIASTSDNLAFDSLIRAMRRADPSDVADAMSSAAAELDGSDLVLYVADFEQQVLEPLPNRSSHEELPHSEEVGTTVAGRAFLRREVIVVEHTDGARVWVPIVEGSDVTGVLALTLRSIDDTRRAQCEDLGVLAGFALAIQSKVTDLYGLHRRRKSMTLAASLQWDLLPPLTLVTPRVAVAGMLEPAYEVGGDCFDYALNGSQLEFAFMDAMGHGLRSAMLAALAVGCFRHDRREGRTLDYIHEKIDTVVANEFGKAFVTGQIGRLDVETGILHWTNAGHPAPLLVRRGRVVRELNGRPTGPWGTGIGSCEIYQEPLEPGDSVLLYTDGITDPRGAPDGFGTERLRDLVDRYASDAVPIGLIVRHVIRAVVDHYGGELRDDATVLMLQWSGPAKAPLAES